MAKGYGRFKNRVCINSCVYLFVSRLRQEASR